MDPGVFGRVQVILQRNARTGGAPVRNQFGALLKGLLRCVPCGCSMTPAHSCKGAKRYRYYTCTNAQSRGWDACPSKSVPAAEIERLVLERVRAHAVHADAPGAGELLGAAWEALSLTEQAKAVARVVERVDYDGAVGKLSIALRPVGVVQPAAAAEEVLP